MAYPEHGATYKNKPAWLDRAIEGEKSSRGDSLSPWQTHNEPMARMPEPDGGALKNAMDADRRQTNETMPSFPSMKDIQAREALEISDAVPRRDMKKD